jgi:CheY-like chemotaxis protein
MAMAVDPGGAAEECLERVRILLVDDEEDFRDSMAAVLSYYGANVTVAVTARQARALLQSIEFDLLISDIEMPIEDGCSLMASIRAMPVPRLRHIHAAALTAACELHMGRARASGFNRVIPKTLGINDFVRVVRDLADSDRVARLHADGSAGTTSRAASQLR